MSNYSVYVITSPEGKKYVGMTMHKPEYRWRNGEGYFQNKRFYADIKKFGWNQFKKEIAKSGMAREEAENMERLLISEYHSQNPNYGYNVEMGGTPIFLAESTKRKMSEAHKGLPRDEIYRKHISESKLGKMNGMYGKTGSLNPKSRRVKRISDDEVVEYESISEASRKLNLSKNAFKNISACCMGKRRSAYGYIWRYCDDSKN